MINLGDKVKDSVSGFTGIAICRHVYLNGCARITLQPLIKKNGELPEAENFDEPQLKVVKRRVVKEGKKDTGGPERYMPNPRSTGKR